MRFREAVCRNFCIVKSSFSIIILFTDLIVYFFSNLYTKQRGYDLSDGGYAIHHILVFVTNSQSRTNWKGCGRKGIQFKIEG